MRKLLIIPFMLFSLPVFADPPLEVIWEEGMGPEEATFVDEKPVEPAEGYHTTRMVNGRKQLFKKDYKPKDYVDWMDRGTVEYDPDKRNYSFMKVVIPKGTVVHKTNFLQRYPRTKAIFCDGCVFVDCNLRNNLVDPSWILISSSNVQTDWNVQVDPNDPEVLDIYTDAEGKRGNHIAPHSSLVPLDHDSRKTIEPVVIQ